MTDIFVPAPRLSDEEALLWRKDALYVIKSISELSNATQRKLDATLEVLTVLSERVLALLDEREMR